MPLVQVDGTAVLAISSPLDENNFASKLTDVVDPKTGQPVFLVISSAMCINCVRDPSVVRCTHKRKRLPAQLNSKNVRIAQALLGDDTAKARRELAGEITGDAEYLLRPWVPALQLRPRLCVDNPQLVWTFVDPAPGAKLSDFAALSICRTRGNPSRFAIVGMDTFTGDGSGKHYNEGHELIMSHMRRMMFENAALCGAHWVVVMEAVHSVDTVGDYARKLIAWFRKNGQINRLYQERAVKHPDAYGVLLDERMKWNMVMRCKRLLETNAISYAQTVSSGNFESCKMKLESQLKQIHAVPKEKTVGDIKYLVKSNGKDDLAICLMSILYHEQRILETPRFREWAQALRITLPRYVNPAI